MSSPTTIPVSIIGWTRACLFSRRRCPADVYGRKAVRSATLRRTGLLRDDQPSRHDRARPGFDARLVNDARHMGLLAAEAGARDSEVHSPAGGALGCFLDTRTEADEAERPALGDSRYRRLMCAHTRPC